MRTHAAMIRSTAALGVVIFALAVGANVAGAQGRPAAQPAPRPAPMSADQQIGQAKTILASGQDLAQRLMRMVDTARREGDVIRVTCLNDKLTETNANVSMAQSRLEALKKAVDAEQRGHEFTVITVIGQKFTTLDQQANQCVGQDMFETGKTKTQTEIKKSLVPMDKTSSAPPTMVAPSVPVVPARSSGVK